jgi:hypothetical protein
VRLTSMRCIFATRSHHHDSNEVQLCTCITHHDTHEVQLCDAQQPS